MILEFLLKIKPALILLAIVVALIFVTGLVGIAVAKIKNKGCFWSIVLIVGLGIAFAVYYFKSLKGG